jgi:hypothetical protein
MSFNEIFLEVDGDLALLSQRPYDSESVLQRALADYPRVLAGLTTAGDNDQGLLLVRQEVGIPTAQGGGNTFAIDHVFLDSEGVPILVEVKRSTDTRIRREVIGQMLDYVANATQYWPIDALRDALGSTGGLQSRPDPERSDELVKAFVPEMEPDEFWARVEENLRTGKVRMIFVADELPANVVRIIEFLNEQMSPAEVLGVELRQYVGRGQVAYVPNIIGQTSAAAEAKSVRQGQWTKEAMFEQVEHHCTPKECAFIMQLFEHGELYSSRFGWGRGQNPGVTCWYPHDGKAVPVWNLSVYPSKTENRALVYFNFQDLANRGLARAIEAAASVLEHIEPLQAKIADSRARGWQTYPSFFVQQIADDDAAIRAVFGGIDALWSDSATAPWGDD